MKYRKNEKMDFISPDESSLVVFDPETGNTYVMDEIGADILNTLDDPCGIDEIHSKLLEIYEDGGEEIKSDIEAFLKDAVDKGIVEIV